MDSLLDNSSFCEFVVNMEEDSSTENFGFAFNDTKFSDRVLHIQVTPNELSSTPKSNKRKHSSDSSTRPTRTHVSNSSAEFQLKSLHLSSLILAAKSPFFHKLFTNGMSESQQQEATFRIHPSEETALMDLLKFMYTNTLSATTCSNLVDVLMAADKFEVKSCITHCLRLLSKLPMSVEIALLYLEIPSTVLVIQQLKDASKQYLVAQFKDFEDSKEKAMELPLDALKIILGSEGLQVNSEDDVYEFILNWARAHYPNLKERKEILNKQLVQFISFQHMSLSSLREALACPDFGGPKVSKLATEALFCKAENPSKYFSSTKTQRLYSFRPLRVVPVEFSLPRCIIFFNLKKQECRDLFPLGAIFSESFLVGSHRFYVTAECEDGLLKSDHVFGLYAHVDVWSKTFECTLDAEWAVMKKSSNEYEIQDKAKDCTVAGYGYGYFFSIPWNTFMSDESDYFIDDVLHLRAELTVINSQP